MAHDHRYIIILAGGSGTRLYPRSREDIPKQFQKIIGDKTLFEQTIDRILLHTSLDRVFVVTSKQCIDLVHRYVPTLPDSNILAEPVRKNTGPALACATALILKRDPDAVIASLHSDHIILKNDTFVASLESAFDMVDKTPSAIVTIGIQPTSPHTGYGYIERNGSHIDVNNTSVYKAVRFVEKPIKKVALDYIRKGTFSWNAGYFIYNADHFMHEIHAYDPAMYSIVTRIVQSYGSPEYDTVLQSEFEKFDVCAIDLVLMEKTKDMYIIPADLGWSDVGSWDSVANLLDDDALDKNENYLEGLTVPIDTHNTIILGQEKKLIATIGLNNVIVVSTDDAILIAERGRSEDVKKVVEYLKANKIDHLL